MFNERKTIMLVDDNTTNLATGKTILKDSYKVYPVLSGEILFDLLDVVYPDLILLDIEMPGMDGYEVIKRLKKNAKLAEIPVVFLTVKSDEVSEFKGLSLGAIDYVTKPFSAPLLIKRIENHLLLHSHKKNLEKFNESLSELVRDKITQVNNLQNAVLSTMSSLVEFRDDVTGNHIMRTQKYLKILIEKMIEEQVYLDEVKSWDMDFIVPSAQLHDLGKIAISDVILNKPGPLTKDEFEIMKTHVDEGLRAIRKIEEKADEELFFRHVRMIVGSHHERWDGTGYPNGLRGTDIPLEGRLMAIADTYDTLISKRPYKSPLSTDEAYSIITEGKDKEFDPALVDVFEKVADRFVEVVKDSLY